MDMRRDKDYRDFVIRKWVSGEIESFRKPSLKDLELMFPYYREIIEKYLPSLTKDASILEIGCGWGSFIYALKRLGFYNIQVIDIIKECCDFVKERFDTHVENKDVFEFLRSTNLKFNLIIAFDVIEHFNKAEILELLHLIYENLEDQGVILVRVPNGGSLKGFYIRYSGFIHEICFTELSINEIFKVIGFKEIKVFPEPYLSKNLLRKTIRKFINKALGKLFSLDFINSGNLIALAKKS